MAIIPTLNTVFDIPYGGGGHTSVVTTTSSVTWNANKYYMACVCGFKLAGFASTGPPVMTGNGLSWQHISGGYAAGLLGADYGRMDLFTAVGTPSVGVIQWVYPSDFVNEAQIVLIEWTGIGLGSATTPIVQQVGANSSTSPAMDAQGKVTLAGFATPTNVGFGFRCDNTSGAGFTTDHGFVVIGQNYTGNNNTGTSWLVNGNPIYCHDEAAGFNLRHGDADGMIAMEIGAGVSPLPGVIAGVGNLTAGPLRIPYYRPTTDRPSGKR